MFHYRARRTAQLLYFNCVVTLLDQIRVSLIVPGQPCLYCQPIKHLISDTLIKSERDRDLLPIPMYALTPKIQTRSFPRIIPSHHVITFLLCPACSHAE
jgi:hypothetical protein